MDSKIVKKILEGVRSGELKIDEALGRLKHLPFEDLGFANIDHHRSLRQGFPECVWGQDKSAEHIVAIVARMIETEQPVIVTRVDKEKSEIILSSVPEMDYHPIPRMLTFTSEETHPQTNGHGLIMVISAGTSDMPVAEEAVITARMMGNKVETLYDAGVAGIHRLVGQFEKLVDARVFIVVAGMEGALPSVVGGLVSRPVIAVPTSVGYGTSFGGIAALLGMLNSCASGVSVVNIDNGFGAGCVASLINRL
jgi:NCAIR mutase (PurE)-related protein